MSDYIISCCSTADLSEKHFLERDIHYICFHYELDGVTYMDDLGKTMDIEDFYKAMTEGADTKTSQINADEYEKYFEDFLKQGKDILHITLSSGISAFCTILLTVSAITFFLVLIFSLGISFP